jgi:hypothetical protein
VKVIFDRNTLTDQKPKTFLGGFLAATEINCRYARLTLLCFIEKGRKIKHYVSLFRVETKAGEQKMHEANTQ